ncbi:MAG: histone deacetylase [Actinomycetota bacterium]|nr:histone deacetylase [Actinomycetota bacterium]
MFDPSGALWYVAYGSNLSWARLRCYLSGGTPSGARRPNPGARDASPPQADEAVTLPGQVYFADQSTMWAGAVAFYDPDVAGPTLARGYLLSAEQFVDVMAQELGMSASTIPGLPALVVGERCQLSSGLYGTLLVCGERHGVPLVTFTASQAMADMALQTPSLAYLATLATGLAESHGLDVAAQSAYLANLPGAMPPWDARGLASALRLIGAEGLPPG